MLQKCTLCPRQCGVDREDDTPSRGVCGMPALPTAARAALHFGEEPCISGLNGSGTVFFSGCSLSCVFCQNREISHLKRGKTVSIDRLCDIFKELEDQGAHNINLVNPTHFASAIREALMRYRPSIPVLYNTGGYERVETLKSLEGLIDIYLPDLKYLSSELSARLSGAKDYPDFATAAILEMVRQTGSPILDENGMMKRGTMVRHLVLPGYTNQSIEVLKWLAQHKDKLWVSIMFQYTPITEVPGAPSLSRTLTKRECEKIWDVVDALGLTDGYVQERESSGTGMIPSFDLTGV